MKGIIEQLQNDNIRELRLGLSPCASIEPSGFSESRLMRSLFQWAFDSNLVNRWAYNLSGARGLQTPVSSRRGKGFPRLTAGLSPAKDSGTDRDVWDRLGLSRLGDSLGCVSANWC